MLSLCVLVFFVRVSAQVEVWLLGPAWLPPMEAWSSGLLPYAVLLPVQILMLMALSVITGTVADRGRVIGGRAGRVLRGTSTAYAVIMLARLVVVVTAPPGEAGPWLPIPFHLVLAMWLYLLATPRKYVPSS